MPLSNPRLFQLPPLLAAENIIIIPTFHAVCGAVCHFKPLHYTHYHEWATGAIKWQTILHSTPKPIRMVFDYVFKRHGT